MASEQFSLCWDNFHRNMSMGMQSLLENEVLVDVTLAIEGRYLKAHKMVLSVCSPYFRELFQSNPCKHPIVFMKDVSYVVLMDLLQFMYQGEVQVAQENLSLFIKTAEALQIKGLTGDNEAKCQHGPKECVYNKIEACGMARNVDQNAVISFVHCIEKGIKTDDSNYKRITKKCGPLLNVNTADIIKCAEGQEGDELMVANGVKTDAVQPSIDGVPTVLYNNYYNDTLEEYNDNFLTIACKLLDDEPAACMHLDNEIW
ncbi:hypothetical protein PPYR_07090 [Photinus pyralis]|uniref:BTB domain-containing protein n=1 Tax=Photinus pyralis TaxID=7054 RepID=A0A5N4APF2_PHOPY|nr:hypothetical protein PPYR_07090 [Photinus pyralis]